MTDESLGYERAREELLEVVRNPQTTFNQKQLAKRSALQRFKSGSLGMMLGGGTHHAGPATALQPAVVVARVSAGTSDVIARVVAEEMTKSLGQPIVIAPGKSMWWLEQPTRTVGA
mgnify:CR=1 FL=1